MRVYYSDDKFNVVISYEHSEQTRAPHTNGPRDVPGCKALSLLQKTQKTRFNTNPSGTEANAAGRSLCARVALESAREVS